MSTAYENKIIPGVCSDHSIVYLHLKCNPTQNGLGMWKLNSSLLNELDFVNSINAVIEETQSNEEFTSKRAKWDYLKFKIKQKAIENSKRKAKEKREEKSKLEKEVLSCQEKLVGDSENEIHQESLRQAQDTLDKMHMEYTRSLIIQSRIDYYEEGEKNSKYFLNLVKRNQEKSLIWTLKNGDTIINEPKLIMEELKQFYESLYTSKNTENSKNWIDELDEQGKIPKISQEDKVKLCEIIT